MASEGGEELSHRRRSIVHLLDGPQDSAEFFGRELFARFVSELMRTLVELAAPAGM